MFFTTRAIARFPHVMLVPKGWTFWFVSSIFFVFFSPLVSFAFPDDIHVQLFTESYFLVVWVCKGWVVESSGEVTYVASVL